MNTDTRDTIRRFIQLQFNRTSDHIDRLEQRIITLEYRLSSPPPPPPTDHGYTSPLARLLILSLIANGCTLLMMLSHII